MCATHSATGTVESAIPAFETLLVHLAVESHGLNQSGMFKLFCRAAGDYFEASGACSTFFSSQDGWMIGETEGCQPWGKPGDPLPAATAQWLGLARTREKATLCHTNVREALCHEGDSQHSAVAVPFLSHGKLLGAALLIWAEATGRMDPSRLEQLTMLGTFFAGLLDNAYLFDQVYRSRQQWVRLIDTIPDAIVVHNALGNIVRINRPLANRVGVHPSKLIGRPIGEVLGNNRRENAGSCPLCSDQQEVFEGPVEVFADCSYLVSTTRMPEELDADVQTIHVLVNIRERLEAERRYRDLFDSIQEGAFFCRPDGRMVGANPALARMLGYASQQELLDANLFEDVVPHAAQRDLLLEELSEVDSLRNHEATLRRKDGSLLEALLHVTAVREPKGSLVQYRGLILDVTDQKVSQAALRRERDFNQSILNHTQNIILVLDASGEIGYVNHRATEIGYSAAALLGLPLKRLIHTSHRPVFQEALRTVLDTGAVRRLELPFLRRNGSAARFVVHLSSMREERGDANSVVVVMTDVTEAALLQAKLAHTEKMAALGQLVSGVAHEVNNPLSAIVGFTDLLLENPELPESAREQLGVILQEAERTRVIVQNMLRFAREVPPQREPVQVNLVLRQTLTLRSYGLTNRDVEIVERLAENLPVVIADPHQLQQVFLNLLNNAFDAIETIPRRGKIEVETVLRSENVEIYFRDNGPGISNPDRIFEPFFTTKPVGKGTGLGLSICYGIVHAHMGEILCQNNASGEGCTFLIRLPAAALRKQATSTGINT
jgi:PAS domain S-box-containing protein